jgi:hypothetical protein
MVVARQFIAWNPFKKGPVPEGRCEPRDPMSSPPKVKELSFRPNHTVPYGTDSRLNLFQAINCLATINRSLRDKNLQHPSTN